MERADAKPRMVLFDYGGTLAHEEEADWARAEAALLQHATRNRDGLTAEQVAAFTTALFESFHQVRMEHRAELPERAFLRFAYEYLGIDFSLSPLEMETILWENASPPMPMAGAETLLSALSAHGIRTAVLSNIAFSGEALSLRLAKLFPGHAFEFVIATSDYILRKPSRMIFELALSKADLSARECWYCGNSFEADVKGALGAGIFPVWLVDKPDGREKGVQCLCIEQLETLTRMIVS